MLIGREYPKERSETESARSALPARELVKVFPRRSASAGCRIIPYSPTTSLRSTGRLC